MDIAACSYIPPQYGCITFRCDALSNYANRNIELTIADILRRLYHIDMDIDGIVVYWAMGVFITYLGIVDGDMYTDKIYLNRIIMASITTVVKFCFDEGSWRISSKVILDHQDGHTLEQLLAVEMGIITTVQLIECFRKYCPLGYALTTMLRFEKIEDEEKN